MTASPVRTRPLPTDAPGTMTPLLPTVVVASFKGGTWKTAVAVALAERLALAGLRVLLVTTDSQEDARARLGVPVEDDGAVRVARASGSVTVVGALGSAAVDLLYRAGPQKYGVGACDVAIVDTPPLLQGGGLPGVLLVATVDGTDAARNLVTMLGRTPENTTVVLVRVAAADAAEWAHDATVISKAATRDVRYVVAPLPRSAPVAQAHDAGRSVWALPRRGNTHGFLVGVDALASLAWERVSPSGSMPALPPSTASASGYVAGWDDDV